MPAHPMNLSDLLTAAGLAMGESNQRLASAGAPALLREFSLEIRLDAAVNLSGDGDGVTLRRTGSSGPQVQAMTRMPSGVTLNATYIAAPALQPRIEGGDPCPKS